MIEVASIAPRSGSATVMAANGWIAWGAVMACPDRAPPMTGGSSTAVTTTVVVASVAVCPAVSETAIAKPVVTVLPGAT